MIKKYNFENSGNKALMAEILRKRGRQPRSLFLSSLAAVMIAAISLTMVFGGLQTNATPLENQEQPNESIVTVSDTLPPEEVIRVHTDTKTKTVIVNNDKPQLSESLLQPEAVSTKAPAQGKAMFNQAKQIFQWQYKGETFTFFVKDNTVYRRSEKTGRTVAMFKGDDDVFLFCLNDRYLYFGAVTLPNQVNLYSDFAYCYRADLITGKMLRLFTYFPAGDADGYSEAFVRFSGTDVVFTHYIVHEDGSYEQIPDDEEHYPDSEEDYPDSGEENNHYDFYDITEGYLELQLNDDNTITGKDENGIYYDTGININTLKDLGYNFDDFWYDEGWICRTKEGYEYIYITFDTIQNYSYESLLLYYGKITDSGLDGAVIYATAPNSRDMFFNGRTFLSTELELSYSCYNIYDEYNCRELYIPVNFDKLSAATKSEPEYYPLDNGEKLTVTYYPCKTTHAATPDSAD